MEVTCPICYDHYNDKEKIPRILSCGHTFCQNCLMDLRTTNILTCPTCRTYFSPEVKQLIKNFTILDYLYSEKANNLLKAIDAKKNGEALAEESKEEEVIFCAKHPQKKAKYFCETDQMNICSKCIVADHKGHRVADVGEKKNVKVF
jgi:tripartite motif-containing protein 23